MISREGGETLTRSDAFLLPHIAGGNRDPKVFYHPESAAYIMVLYLDGSEFAIFRSPDLLHWTEASRLNADGMWECPDLFRLPSTALTSGCSGLRMVTTCSVRLTDSASRPKRPS